MADGDSEIWTHLGGQRKIPTIGYIGNVPTNISSELIKRKSEATGAVRVGRGFKLYFPTPNHLYEALMNGCILNGSYRSIDIWIPSSRCSICGSPDHFHKNCENQGNCQICDSSHSFSDCPSKMEVLREERNKKLNQSWESLEKWIAENGELEDLTLSQFQGEEKQEQTKQRKINRPTPRYSNPAPFRNAWNSRQQSNKHSVERKNTPDTDCLTAAKEIIEVLKNNENENDVILLQQLQELKEIQEERHELEKKMMDSLIKENKFKSKNK